MKFAELAEYLHKLEKTSSRLEITEILAELIKKLGEGEVGQAINLMLGQLGPSFSAPVFNVAEQMNIEAIAQAFDVEKNDVKKKYKELGDQGDAAQSFSSKKHSDISVSDLSDVLIEVANFEGEGSVDLKINRLASLYESLDALSLRYVARIPIGKLRLGFSEKTLIDALSIAEVGDTSAKKDIESAFAVVPDIARLAKTIKKEGLQKATKNIIPQVGIPVMPMLAARLKSTNDMIKKMREVSVEPKFDGLRVFIHYKKGEPVKAFSRNMNRIEESFPELQRISEYTDAKELIVDSEAIGVDPKTEKFVDFQKTISRRRKHDIKKSSEDTPLTFQVFDIVMKDGTSFMDTDYIERREVLEKVFSKNKLFIVDEKTITKDPAVIVAKHKEYRDKGLEGVIVKKVDSKYIAGRTGWRWVKMKEEESKRSMLSDTIDAVVMGYTQGKGKRAKFGIGQFLAGVRNGETYLTITKVGTGLSDEQFKTLHTKLSKITVKNMPKEYRVTKELAPDFWVEPEVVVELAADEISVSPPNKHTAGYALRFPRLVRFRDDKSAKQATTLKEVKSIK